MNVQVKKIRAEIKVVKLIIQANRAQGAFSEGYLIGQESVLEHFEKFVNSMQEEPIHRTNADVDAAMAEIEEKSKAFTEAHKGETAEEILAQIRGKVPVSKVWHGAKERPERNMARCAWVCKDGVMYWLV